MTNEDLKTTRANTEFMDWWKLLNTELERLGWPEAGMKDARGCYEMGETPETAAPSLIKAWS